MISRLTAFAAAFAVIGAATLTFAVHAHQQDVHAASSAKPPVRYVQLERVVVTGKRSDLVAQR